MNHKTKQLTFSQKLSLYEWLKRNEERIKSSPTESIAKVRAEARESLGFPVSQQLIRNMAKETGLAWLSDVAKRRTGKTPNRNNSFHTLRRIASILLREAEIVEQFHNEYTGQYKSVLTPEDKTFLKSIRNQQPQNPTDPS